VKGLTRKQREILHYIEEYITENRFSPSYREIMNRFSLKSPGSVYKYVHTLSKKGFISHDARSARSMQPTAEKAPRKQTNDLREVPFIGTIDAQNGIELFSQSEPVLLPKIFCPEGEKVYILEVQGEGFVDELIDHTDWLVIDSRLDVHDGEMVVALIDSQVPFIKKYFLEEDYVRLEGRQDAYQPIVLHQSDITLQGVVASVIRTL